MKRRRLRRVGFWLLLLPAGPALYVIAAFGLALIPVNRGFVESPDGIEIFLLSNGIHVDFLLPVKTGLKDWSSEIRREDFPAVDGDWGYLLLGWGDRGFYLETPTWSDLKASNVVRALLWFNASVMHAQYVRDRPDADAACRPLRICGEAYARLCRFLEGSLQRGPRGNIVLIPGKGYGSADNFYEGTGSYHAFNTCNNWTNRGLKTLGARTALWSPFPQGILWHLP